jgi:ubiquinone/menaquinone biosynthesis C-methylase UbiE
VAPRGPLTPPVVCSLVARNYDRRTAEFRQGGGDDFPGLDWRVSSDDRLLDLGCGAGGSMARFAANQSATGWRCGLDISEAMLRSGRELFEERAERATWALGDAATLPFATSSFDFVISANALSHRDRMECVYREIRRVVKSGGRVALKFRDARLLDRPVEALFRAALRETLPDPQRALEDMYRPARLDQGVATARAVGFRVDHVSSLRIDRKSTVDESVRRFRVVAGYMFAAIGDADRTRLVDRLRELLEPTAHDGFVLNYEAHGTLFLRA